MSLLCRSFSLILIVCTVIAGYWWYALVWSPLTENDAIVRVHFLDVGQGDATLITTQGGRQVLVDAGRGVHILTALDAVMPIGDTSLDVAVMTHPDADHIGGFPPVFDRYTVQTVLHSFVPSSSGVYHTVMDHLAAEMSREGGQSYRIASAYRFVIDGVTFSVLWPLGQTVRETNAASVVMLVSYGDIDVLLTGDAPAAVEDMLLTIYPNLLADVAIVKAGHHGSKTSLSPALLARTSPRAVVFSYGADNRYGHPHDVVLKRVAALPDARAYRTTDGTVSFCLTRETFARC